LTEPLDVQATHFAVALNDLLNRTVASEVTLRSTRRDDRTDAALVGLDLGEGIRPQTFPVATPHMGCLHLLVYFAVRLDPEGVHMAMSKSIFGVYGVPGPSGGDPLVRYDYNRDMDGYPSAHIQVHGESQALGRLNALANRTKRLALSKLHFPVGGKRFRPCLEDLLEFLIVEGFVAPVSEGWQAAINNHRSTFHRRQLLAAIRRDPDTARQAFAADPTHQSSKAAP
jgi:hypothetical protein